MKSIRFNKKVIILGKMSLALFFLWLLIHTAQIDLILLQKLLHKPILLFSVVVIFLLMVVLGSWRWQVLNTSQAIQMGTANTVLVTYLGAAFNNLLPGAVGGDLIRLYYVFKRAPSKKTDAALSIFFDRFLGLMGVFLAISLVASLQLNAFRQQPELIYMLGLCALIFGGALVGFALIFLLPQKINLQNKLPQSKFTRPLISFFERVKVYRISTLALTKCLILSLVIQLMIAYAALLISQIMSFPPIPFAHFVIAIGITQIVNLVPLTPGGIGIGELAFANILMILNPGAGFAFATIYFSYRLISALAYLPGVICYIPSFMLMRSTAKESASPMN